MPESHGTPSKLGNMVMLARTVVAEGGAPGREEARRKALDLQAQGQLEAAFRELVQLPARGQVLRDLYLLKFDKTLSFGEKRMLDHAQQLLVKELAMAKDMVEQDVELELEQIFADAVASSPENHAADKKTVEPPVAPVAPPPSKPSRAKAAVVEVVPEPEPEPEPAKLPAKPKSRSTARPKAKTGTLRS